MVPKREDARSPARVWTMRAGLMALRGIGRAVAAASPLPEAPFFEPSQFPWVPRLEARWREMRAEAEGLLDHLEHVPTLQDISPDQPVIGTDDRWRTFFLYGYGHKSEVACAQFPVTTELIEQIPGITTALISIMLPGKHIPTHRGPYAGFLRYHLGLIVPDPARCRLRVGDQWKSWREGESLVFDDTFEHEAINGSDGLRVVLIVDFPRPLPRWLAPMNQAVLDALGRSPMLADARRNQALWEQRWLRAKG